MLEYFRVGQAGDGLGAKLQHVAHFEQRKAAQANRRLVNERVRVGDMAFQRGLQSGQCLLVKAEHQFFRHGGGENFIEENFEARVRDEFEAERRFAHFAHPASQRGDVLGAKMCV